MGKVRFIHPDLPDVISYANDVSDIPAFKGVDKSKYVKEVFTDGKWERRS
tara:strand:- start:390 stop:539 length:150 start_codon:yes stop_codon:yes gene_type:complete